VLRIAQRDVKTFLAASAGSRVFDASEALPDLDGRYQLAAVDIAQPLSPDSGSGVLARVSLQAIGRGLSPLALPLIDDNGDGVPELGPSLVDAAANRLGDANGDTLLDNPAAAAWIAVDSTCPTGVPPGTATPPITPTPAATVTEGPDGGGAGILNTGDGRLWPWVCIAGGPAALAVAGLAVGYSPGRPPRR
jgi:hypothetical protein